MYYVRTFLFSYRNGEILNLMNQRGFSPILIILILLGLFGIIVGVYYLGKVSNWQTKRVNITKDYSFNLSNPTDNYFIITYPPKYSIGVDKYETLRIYDDQKRQVLSIYNYAGGESGPAGGRKLIDGVPFTLDYNNIECLSEISPTNWQPGAQSLLNIHVDCNEATQEELDAYTKIIENIKFNPALKKTLLGK